jgi:carboxyl-terminal processing protease
MGRGGDRMMRYAAALDPKRRPHAASRWRAVAGAIVLFLSACAGHRDTVEPHAEHTLPPVATRLFTVAYDQIAERYVQYVSLGTLTDAGLSNLGKLDAKFEVRRRGGKLELRENGVEIAALDLPAREDDARRWAQVMVAALDAGRVHSPALRAAPPEALYQAVFDGVLGQLDPYSRYSGQEMARESRASRDGFGGIGITIDADSGDVRVASVIEGSPAARSGLAVDDRITHVDGESIAGLPTRDVVRRLRGPIGRTVNVIVLRAGRAEPTHVAITRTLIVPPTVAYKRDGNVAHIRLSGFNHRTTDILAAQIKAAMNEIGPNIEGVILDLRGNLGGLLDQAISVSDLFLPGGQIVSTRGRHRASAQFSDASPGDLAETIPLVVLVNGGSASASEIVAAALQDNSRAVVIGSTSFGKGSVQTVVSLPNEGELVLTWARFYAPSGYPLQDLGILPAVCTSGATASAAEILDAIRAGRLADVKAMAKWRAADHNDKAGLKALREICAPEARERDVDVEVARALLSDRPLYARALQSVQLAARRPGAAGSGYRGPVARGQ